MGTRAVRNDQDDATADWTAPVVVSKCGPTTSSGTGCFLVTNPFPAPVSSLTFATAAGNPPFSGSGSNNPDYAIGRIATSNDYAVRTSAKTVRAYVSNKNLGAVQALEPNGPAFTALQPVKINDGQDDLTLSTAMSRRSAAFC